MRQQRKNRILAFLALVLAVFAPQEVERASVGPARRCAGVVNYVHALFPSIELEFAAPLRPPGAGHDHPFGAVPLRAPAYGAVHLTRRGTLDEAEYDRALTAAPAFSVPVFDLLPLPAPPVSVTLPPVPAISRGIEIRGPPPRVALFTPSLRAPPTA